jgi:hypothetical protein
LPRSAGNKYFLIIHKLILISVMSA